MDVFNWSGHGVRRSLTAQPIVVAAASHESSRIARELDEWIREKRNRIEELQDRRHLLTAYQISYGETSGRIPFSDGLSFLRSYVAITGT